MPSNARLSFDENAKDIQRLLEIHETVGGNVQGRRYQLEVLNKSAIVLITAFWEAYCEDIASEALSNIITNSTNSTNLPDELKKIVAKQLKAETHELAIWRLADNGWKTCLNDRFEAMRLDRDKKLNTPKTVQINSLFYDTIGLKDVSKSWYWQNMSVTNSAKTLDKWLPYGEPLRIVVHIQKVSKKLK